MILRKRAITDEGIEDRGPWWKPEHHQTPHSGSTVHRYRKTLLEHPGGVQNPSANYPIMRRTCLIVNDWSQSSNYSDSHFFILLVFSIFFSSLTFGMLMMEIFFRNIFNNSAIGSNLIRFNKTPAKHRDIFLPFSLHYLSHSYFGRGIGSE